MSHAKVTRLRAILAGLLLATLLLTIAGPAVAGDPPVRAVVDPDQTCVYDDLGDAGGGVYCTMTLCLAPPLGNCV